MSNPRPIAPAPPPPPVASSSSDTAQLLSAASVLSSSAPSHSPSTRPAAAAAQKEKPVKKPRRSKVAEACRFCRRSHMSCDAGRPCSRCVKRDIAHLCRDEPLPGGSATSTAPASPSSTPAPQLPPPQQQQQMGGGANLLGLDSLGAPHHQGQQRLSPALSPQQHPGLPPSLSYTSQGGQEASTSVGAGGGGQQGGNAGAGGGGGYGGAGLMNTNFNLAMLDLATSQTGLSSFDLDLGLSNLGNGNGNPTPSSSGGAGLDVTLEPSGEFHGLGLSEFLQSLTDSSYLTTTTAANEPQQQQQPPTFADLPTNSEAGLAGGGGTTGGTGSAGGGQGIGAQGGTSAERSVPGSPVNKTERFLLTAADQKDGSRSDRLARVIHAKFEAGLLRPYNHVAGYTRLMRWMGDNMSPSSRQRTLHTLSEFRPAFRAIASGLTDLDLVFIEEAFERLLLDYDRVFSSMGIPSCLWRRTGEIYKGNKEFAALVGVPIEHLQGGKLAIYELMGEESAVNYWEKYGNIAFDAGQKAVLTSCVLVNQSVLSRNRKRKKLGADGKTKQKAREEAMINCCFSFTIRRDSYAIPSMIVGNFLRF